ncbi:MAG: hypothetical protein U5P10_07865 [Spirochaetia bacterium]|nr:hypothetical protein [Spirochaetia bacterium]
MILMIMRGKRGFGGNPSKKLSQCFTQIYKEIGGEPSILVRSPHGMHAFYLLNELLPGQLLQELTERLLKGVENVEVRCGAKRTTRVPVEKYLLNPFTCAPWVDGMYTAMRNARRYHPSELFGFDYLPVSDSRGSSKKRDIPAKKHSCIQEAENRLLPFVNYATNDTFLELCNIYRRSGLTEQEATERMVAAVERSPRYTRDLRNPNIVRRRVRWEYENNKSFEPEKSN